MCEILMFQFLGVKSISGFIKRILMHVAKINKLEF